MPNSYRHDTKSLKNVTKTEKTEENNSKIP